MTELHWYVLFLFVWMLFQSHWVMKLSKQVAELRSDLEKRRDV